jgi:hypothetical protein
MNTYCEPEYQRLLNAWQQATMVPSVNPDIWRKDHAGNLMKWLDYDDPSSEFGWTVSSMSESAKRRIHRGPTCEAVNFKNLPSKKLRAG